MIEAISSGRILENGSKIPVELKVGDRVLYSRYAGNEFKFDGEECLIVSEPDLLALMTAKSGAKTTKAMAAKSPRETKQNG